jgi:hypothetical protein
MSRLMVMMMMMMNSWALRRMSPSSVGWMALRVVMCVIKWLSVGVML